LTIKILNALLAIIGGIGGAMILFWLLNKLAESLKGRWEDRVKPWVFAGPAILAIGVYLIYPAIVTLQYSFANEDATKYVGFNNYKDLLTDATFLSVLFNNLLWIIIVPALTVALGLGVAVLADRLRPKGEKLSKTVIFLPMAISMVGAATIWRSIYEYQPKGSPQTGLLNAIMGVFGKDPVSWYQIDTLALQQPAVDDHPHLDPGGLLHGVALLGHQVAFPRTPSRPAGSTAPVKGDLLQHRRSRRSGRRSSRCSSPSSSVS
jgi:alpha-glucoside transport system permease protein